MLQQYLPLAVLKPANVGEEDPEGYLVATVLTACGIETYDKTIEGLHKLYGCNSTYRLRY